MSHDQAVNGTALLGEEDDPSPSPSPPSARRLGLFFSGTNPEASWPETETATATGEHPSHEPSDAAWDSAGDETTSDPGDSPEQTGPPASSADDPPALLSKHALKQTFRAGVQTTTVVAHKVAARTPGQQEVGLYLADSDDCAAIGDPLASIAHRRGGLAGGQLSPDTNDFLQAVMGIVGYLSKQMRGLQDARTIDGQIQAGVRPHPSAGYAFAEGENTP